jgi:hypothetical protein
MGPDTEKAIGGFSLALAVLGAAFSLAILMATGMSNDQEGSRKLVWLAFVAPVFALGTSASVVISAYGNRRPSRASTFAIAAAVISAAMILLTIAALRA